MKTRRVMALALLASVVWVLSAPVAASSAGAAAHHSVAWAYYLGLDRDEAFWFGLISAGECFFVPGIGSLACGALGVF